MFDFNYNESINELYNFRIVKTVLKAVQRIFVELELEVILSCHAAI